MNKSLSLLLLTMFWSFWSGVAGATEPSQRLLDVAKVNTRVNVSMYFDYVEQVQRVFTIEDLLADQVAGDIPWTANHNASPGFGFDANTFWFRLIVNNSSNQDLSRLLEIDNPVLDDVQFYQVDAEGYIIEVSQTGDQNPAVSRPYFHHNLVLPFSVSAGATHFLYFRVTTSGALEFPVELWEPKAFQEQDQSKQLFFGALFGVLAVMWLYNVFIFILYRDKSMAYYSVVSLSLLAFLSTIHGFTGQYLWPDNAWLREYALVVIIPLCQFFALMFSRHFLQLSTAYPRVDRLLWGIALLCLVLTVLPLALDYAVLIRLNAALVVPVCLGGVLIGCKRWLDGYQPARYFMIAWVTFMLAVAFYALSKFGLFPRSLISEYAIQLGAVMEVVLFAFALADRMNTQRRAYEQAQLQALELQKAANERLESSVTARTMELRSAMANLEQANQRLQALSMQDGLTGIRNRRYFDSELEHEWQRCLRSQDSMALLLIDIDFFKAFNDKYGHLAGDECLKLVAKVIERGLTRPSDSVARFGGEEFAVILPETDINGALHVAEGIRLAVEQKTIEIDNTPLHVTISLGAASTIPQFGEVPSSLISMADQALYQAKSEGRNRACIAPKV